MSMYGQQRTFRRKMRKKVDMAAYFRKKQRGELEKETGDNETSIVGDDDEEDDASDAELQATQDESEEDDDDMIIDENIDLDGPAIKKRKKESKPKSKSSKSKEEDNVDLPGAATSLQVVTSEDSFESLKGVISERTYKGIQEMGFTKMTEIQAKTIPHLLEGRDLIGSARTGSGKTLAFLIPAVELLRKLKFQCRNGTGCIIISPTRELAMQTYGVLVELLKFHNMSYGILMGGANRRMETERFYIGVNIVVATPGRLIDHIQNTEAFMYKNLQCLVIDEADRLLAMGFEQEMKLILKFLPTRRQTVVFSATLNSQTKELIDSCVKKNPLKVFVDEDKKISTAEGIEQGFVVCPSEKRFMLLFTFLKKNRNKKVMVFFSSCMSVKFHYELFNYIDMPVMSIHGKLAQKKRTLTFFSFCNAEKGVLLCTDIAARGLDIPAVDWIVQYDPPDDPKEYIHRVGRTARGDAASGNALLVLRPEETGFLRFLLKAKVPINEYELSWSKISDVQPQLEKVVTTNYYLNLAARDAYAAYVHAYASHTLKEVFDITLLDFKTAALAFGLVVPPKVHLRNDVSMSRGGHRIRNRLRKGIEKPEPQTEVKYEIVPVKKKKNKNTKNGNNN